MSENRDQINHCFTPKAALQRRKRWRQELADTLGECESCGASLAWFTKAIPAARRAVDGGTRKANTKPAKLKEPKP